MLATVDRQLNAMAHAFLLPLSWTMSSVILSDLSSGLRWAPADIAGTPIQTTNDLIEAIKHGRYPAIAGITGLQRPLTDKNLPAWLVGYVNFWKWCPLWIFAVAALLSCGVFGFRDFRSNAPCQPWSLGLALLMTGTGLMFLNCSLTYNLPRFWMPFLILMEISILIAVTGKFGARAGAVTSISGSRECASDAS